MRNELTQKDGFIILIVELQEYYEKKLTSFGVKTWYKYLSNKLSLEELKLAIELSIAEDPFLPTPKQLVEKVKGNVELEAEEEFYKLMKEVSGGRKKLEDTQLKQTTKEVCQLLGGLAELGRQEEGEVIWYKKNFISLYQNKSSLKRSKELPIENKILLDAGINIENIARKM